ncbi:hypothetical protein [Haloferula sp.]|uniref:hypothetical protein n=1 Tax=Haloferula sp. TaxID=2497595 RepID=UPI00329BF94A
MKSALGILAGLVVLVSSSAADLPSQSEVFAIGIFSPAEHNLVSRDYLFSALPYYEEIDESTARDYPSHKTSWAQSGAIVTKNGEVLMFSTRMAKYLSIVDSANGHTFYRLKSAPRSKVKCPRPAKNLADLPFPSPDEIFTISTYPWNTGKHFTADSLKAALPDLRLLTKEDVPALACESQLSGTKRLVYSPAEWSTPAGRRADVQNGVIVLRSREVIRWSTSSSTAIAFHNYRPEHFYVIDRK